MLFGHITQEEIQMNQHRSMWGKVDCAQRGKACWGNGHNRAQVHFIWKNGAETPVVDLGNQGRVDCVVAQF